MIFALIELNNASISNDSINGQNYLLFNKRIIILESFKHK